MHREYQLFSKYPNIHMSWLPVNTCTRRCRCLSFWQVCPATAHDLLVPHHGIRTRSQTGRLPDTPRQHAERCCPASERCAALFPGFARDRERPGENRMQNRYSQSLRMFGPAKDEHFLGPWAPSTRVFSISAVRLGPVARLIMEGMVPSYFCAADRIRPGCHRPVAL